MELMILYHASTSQDLDLRIFGAATEVGRCPIVDYYLR